MTEPLTIPHDHILDPASNSWFSLSKRRESKLPNPVRAERGMLILIPLFALEVFMGMAG